MKNVILVTIYAIFGFVCFKLGRSVEKIKATKAMLEIVKSINKNREGGKSL